MIFSEDLMNPEGPVRLPNGDWLVVEMAPERGCVTRVSADGTKRTLIAKTGRPNGLAVDREGTIWVAESKNPPSLLRMTQEGDFEIFMKGPEDDVFLFSNDLVFGPDGTLWMTDSGVLEPEWRAFRDGKKDDVTVDGKVWRIDLSAKTASKIDSGLGFANGIAYGPDGYLYANETMTGDIFKYDLSNDEPNREFFANAFPAEEMESHLRGVDGMAFDDRGRLYVTVIGYGDVAVFDPDGSLERRIPLIGKRPTNVAFGAKGEKRIYVTEQGIGQIEACDVDADGMELF
ncbi:MAG: SMP-30/gluconolactonase/LRE family protein [Candidatus Latescibacterota bacterium]|nr:SMP-30/gluconolactonase/LRE family protein [Candidatus Latescibacterota bacterium]